MLSTLVSINGASPPRHAVQAARSSRARCRRCVAPSRTCLPLCPSPSSSSSPSPLWCVHAGRRRQQGGPLAGEGMSEAIRAAGAAGCCARRCMPPFILTIPTFPPTLLSAAGPCSHLWVHPALLPRPLPLPVHGAAPGADDEVSPAWLCLGVQGGAEGSRQPNADRGIWARRGRC